MKFVMPLSSNSELVDYNAKLVSSLIHRNRRRLCGFTSHDDYSIYIYQEQSLLAEKYCTFISMITDDKKKQSEYSNASRMFGKISILSNIRDKP